MSRVSFFKAQRILELSLASSQYRHFLSMMFGIFISALVGVPNAGKSTFLASVTRAKPKIANVSRICVNQLPVLLVHLQYAFGLHIITLHLTHQNIIIAFRHVSSIHLLRLYLILAYGFLPSLITLMQQHRRALQTELEVVVWFCV